MKKKIVVTGGSGRFGKYLRNLKTKHKIFFPTKKELNILNLQQVKKYLVSKKPDILIHLAGLSRPMNVHEQNIERSIDLNIVGTANITKVCANQNIKLIYFSTNYVYPGKKGNYREIDPLFPVNNYAWSKLGGEASVQLYKNSLILRVCMTEKPFVHKKAFYDFITNFIFHDDAAHLLYKIINKKGVINFGGKKQSVYLFGKKYNKRLKKISAKKIFGKNYPLNPSMNIDKLKKILKN